MTLRHGLSVIVGLLTLSCAATRPTTSLREELPPWQTPTPPPPGPSLQERIAGPSRASTVAETPVSREVEPGEGTVCLSFHHLDGNRISLHLNPQSRSLGSPNRGRLQNGKVFPKEGPGWRRFSPNAWGTEETVALLEWALTEWRRTFPDAPPVVVGALSREGGGKLRPHKSHQSGRDVDIGLVPADGQARGGFVPLPVSRLDLEKTVYLMALMASTGRLQAIFIHRSLVSPLQRAAERMNLDREVIVRLFGGPGQKGIVQPWKGHRAHFHARFACPAGDPSCHEEAVRLAPRKQAKVAGASKKAAAKKEKQAQQKSRKVLTTTTSGGRKSSPSSPTRSGSRENRRRY